MCVSILPHGWITWMLTKCREQKLDENYTRILYAILNKSWKQHPTKQQLYSHLLPISQIMKDGRIRYPGHYWRSKDDLFSDILLWNPTRGHSSVSRPAKTYLHQHCADTGRSLENLPRVIDHREGWQEKSGTSLLSTRLYDDDDDGICLPLGGA